jgi:3-hydroxyisobutyrate dehydrogenase/2-hydroxy-3-oxopropionate reductase
MSPPDEPATAVAEQGRSGALSTMTVAVVGTGRMGSAMAGRLCEQGASVLVYNRTRDRADRCAADTGANVVATPAAAAAAADILITMLADDNAVTTLYRDRDGILEGLSSRTVAVDMSTVLPETLRNLEPDVRATGAGLVDAPVSGSVSLAERGQLTIMAGGEGGDVDRARPALEALSTRIFHLGPLGSGATMKLAVNAIVFGLGASISEALVLAEKAGVDRSTAYEVFAASTFRSPFLDYKRAAFVDPDTTPVAFSVALARKDLGLILELARRVEAEMPQAVVNLDILGRTAVALGDERDFADVAEYLRERRTGMA